MRKLNFNSESLKQWRDFDWMQRVIERKWRFYHFIFYVSRISRTASFRIDYNQGSYAAPKGQKKCFLSEAPHEKTWKKGRKTLVRYRLCSCFRELLLFRERAPSFPASLQAIFHKRIFFFSMSLFLHMWTVEQCYCELRSQLCLKTLLRLRSVELRASTSVECWLAIFSSQTSKGNYQRKKTKNLEITNRQ